MDIKKLAIATSPKKNKLSFYALKSLSLIELTKHEAHSIVGGNDVEHILGKIDTNIKKAFEHPLVQFIALGFVVFISTLIVARNIYNKGSNSTYNESYVIKTEYEKTIAEKDIEIAKQNAKVSYLNDQLTAMNTKIIDLINNQFMSADTLRLKKHIEDLNDQLSNAMKRLDEKDHEINDLVFKLNHAYEVADRRLYILEQSAKKNLAVQARKPGNTYKYLLTYEDGHPTIPDDYLYGFDENKVD